VITDAGKSDSYHLPQQEGDIKVLQHLPHSIAEQLGVEVVERKQLCA
jgi:hypothetical protein